MSRWQMVALGAAARNGWRVAIAAPNFMTETHACFTSDRCAVDALIDHSRANVRAEETMALKRTSTAVWHGNGPKGTERSRRSRARSRISRTA